MLSSGMAVRHVDGGQGTVVKERWLDGGYECLVEWDDESRTWEATIDLEALQ